MIGKQILHYRIVEKLGEGGMGVVYRAEDTKLHRSVALKFLPDEALERPEDRARFVAEARAAAALDHANICTVHDINEVDGHHFISMAFVEGRDLKDIVDESGPLKVLDAVRIGVQVAGGLSAAHEKGIVHRDIKSANVMVNERGRAKIMDFGLAHQSRGAVVEAEGSTLGTIAYASPEQTHGDEVDHRTDIWSFGVMLYEILTGKLPFKGDYESAIVYSILNETPEAPSSVRRGIPEDVDRIVMRALAKSPDDRYQSAEEMRTELAAVRNALDPTISRAAASAPRERDAGHTVRRVLIAGGVYLGVSWLLSKLVGLVVGNMQMSPHIVDIANVALLSLLPAVILWAFFSARRGSARWGRPEMIGVPVNLLASVGLLLVMFSGKDLGAATQRVEVTNEEGETIERVIPRGAFLKKFEIFPFENRSGDEDLAWLGTGMPSLIEYDVLQDPFLQVISSLDAAAIERAREAGFQSLDEVPLALKRKIAGERHVDYFVVGSIDKSAGARAFTVEVYETWSGRLVSETSYPGADVFAAADDISSDLMQSLEVPEWHLDGATDLPVAEMVTNSEDAMRSFALAQKAMMVDSDWEAAREYLEAATDADSTMAFAHFAKYVAYRLSNDAERSMEGLEAALRHAYKVPERMRFVIKANYYFARQEPEKVVAVGRMMTELYPDDILGYQILAQVHSLRNEVDESIATSKKMLEIDPLQYDLLQQVGELYRRQGQFDSSLVYYERYADANPKDPSSFLELGDVYLSMGDFDKAKASYDKALLLEPDRVMAQLKVGSVEFAMARYETALDTYEEALRTARSVADSVRALSTIEEYFAFRGEFNKAVELQEARFAMADRVSSPLQAAMNRIEEVDRYVHAGRTDEAFEEMRWVEEQVTSPPFDKAVNFGYVLLYDALEDPDRMETALNGLDEYITSLGIEVLRPAYNGALGRLQEMRAQYEDAIVSYQRVLAGSPTNTKSMRGVMRCLQAQDRLDDAEAWAKRLLKHAPNGARANYEIALLYHAMNRHKEARAHLDIALEAWTDADPSFKPAAQARRLDENLRSASSM